MPRAIHPLITKVAVDWLATNAPAAVPDELRGLDLERTVGVDVELHRAALEAVYEAGGPAAVARLPAVLAEARGEPLIYVMLNSSSVADLVDKEARLERFWHSHHRVRVHELTEHVLELEHYARSGRKPVRAESLFVFGARAVLLAAIGCDGLTVSFPRSADTSAVPAHGELDIPDGDLSWFRFEWTSFEAARQALDGLDDLLLERSTAQDLGDLTTSDEVETIIRQDLAHRWTVAEVARLSGRSARSLQRALSAEETSFSSVVDRVRVEEAAAMLRGQQHSVTEVGYCCGFSDAAHFSRRFKALMGLPPSQYPLTDRGQ